MADLCISLLLEKAFIYDYQIIIMLSVGIPFEMTMPISGIVYMLIVTFVVTLLVAGSGKIVSHGMGIKHIFMLSLVSYAITLIVLSSIAKYLPFQTEFIYIAPFIVWFVVGKFVIKTYGTSSLLVSGFIGYAIFMLMTLMKVNLLVAQYIH